jgi:hypothetical protein
MSNSNPKYSCEMVAYHYPTFIVFWPTQTSKHVLYIYRLQLHSNGALHPLQVSPFCMQRFHSFWFIVGANIPQLRHVQKNTINIPFPTPNEDFLHRITPLL